LKESSNNSEIQQQEPSSSQSSKTVEFGEKLCNQLKNIFELADSNHNGLINRDEFTLLLKPGVGIFNGSGSSSDSMISEKEGDELFKEADKNNDEALSLQEIGDMLNIKDCNLSGESVEGGKLSGESGEVKESSSSVQISSPGLESKVESSHVKDNTDNTCDQIKIQF